MTQLQVQLSNRSYPVLIGTGVRQELPSVIPAGVSRVAVVSQRNIADIAEDCAAIVAGATPERAVKTFFIPDTEAAKSTQTIEQLCRQFADWGLTRADLVLGVGGGVVTDVAGFAAAVYHRGVAVIHAATTLLAQIDAAIGGKTGVNIPEGKNLIGAFWQPHAVICDTDTLSTLPERELRCGYGEMAKYHFLGAGRMDADAGQLDELPLEQQVARCVQLKADIVSADEREQGQRALLNYGHTLAHALESAGGYAISHGEAVAVGLVYAAEVAKFLGRIDDDRLAEHRRVVSGFGLATDLPGLNPCFSEIPSQDLLDFFKRDKKATQGLTMILDGPAGPEVVSGLDGDLLLSAMEQIR